MEKCLKGKRILVTGGSRGIGRAISELFAEHGANVLINYSSQDDGSGHIAARDVLNSIKDKSGSTRNYDLDISDISGHNKMLNFMLHIYGGLDILVNNAGIAGGFIPYDEITEQHWDRVQEVNVKGAFFLTQKSISYMNRNQPNEYGLKGSIIFMSSISKDRGGLLQHHYCPTKAGLSSLVRCFSESLGPKGIRVNGIAPGTIVTDMNRSQLEKDRKGTELMRKSIPLQRLGEPEDVAQVALFLAYDKMSRYVNGAIIDVNGGWHNVLAGQSK